MLMLQTGKETIAVQLGPAWYIDKQRPRIQPNDTIKVTGSRVTMDGRSMIVAADITKGNELLKLREANGIAVWPRSPLRRGAEQTPKIQRADRVLTLCTQRACQEVRVRLGVRRRSRWLR